MTFSHKLMENNITKDDLEKVKNFLRRSNIFTQSKNVSLFEKRWSKWLGVKYSVFVNSGSSANLITMNILKIIKGKGDVIVPSFTWVSDISSVLQNNLNPVFVDINPKNLCMSEDDIMRKVNKKTIAVFLSHMQGFNGLSNKLLSFLKRKKIMLIEDVCESHGATFKNKKLGSYGKISNFSYYYAHHMSTIEGGMVCTNDKKIYHLARMLRSHGMAREIGDRKVEKKIIRQNPQLSPQFIFVQPGYNLRNTEIGAVIGLNQLKKLDKNNKNRIRNFRFFLNNLNKNKYRTDFDLKGNCNYSFPVILKKASINQWNTLANTLKNNNIEYRKGNAGGGNQLRQPYLKQIKKRYNIKNFKEVDHIHFFSCYIGNYPTLSTKKIMKICSILNSVNYGK